MKDYYTPQFPSPLEVNRFISARYGKTAQSASLAFPSPLEVYSFIPYSNNIGWVYDSVGVPSPRKGNRLLSSSDDEHLEYVAECFRPLARYIGLYRSE